MIANNLKLLTALIAVAASAGAQTKPPAEIDSLLASLPGTFEVAAGQYTRLLESVKGDPRSAANRGAREGQDDPPERLDLWIFSGFSLVFA